MGNCRGKHNKKNPVVKRVLRGVYYTDGASDADDRQGGGIQRIIHPRTDRDRRGRRC